MSAFLLGVAGFVLMIHRDDRLFFAGTCFLLSAIFQLAGWYAS